MNFTEAFNAAGSPVGNPRNQWSAMSADRSFVTVTIWEDEYADYTTNSPVLGPVHPRAGKYFHTDVEAIEQWRAARLKEGKRDINSLSGWTMLKRHISHAFDAKLPLRIIIVQRGGFRDNDVSIVADARYRDDWCAAVTYFDSATGAYEYAIWRRVVKQPNPNLKF